MLRTLIRKEVHESLLSFRFLFGALLCLVLIPLGIFISSREYEQKRVDYQEALRLYTERTQGQVYSNMEAVGFRPPSVLSVLSLGLEPFLPSKVTTSPDGDFRAEKDVEVGNPDSLLFGKVDLLFNIGFVISLLGLIFTFNSVSGEKESSALRLIMANSVPRWQIIVAKMIGNYLVLVIPFVLSLVIGVLILSLSGGAAVFSGQLLPALAVVFAAVPGVHPRHVQPGPAHLDLDPPLDHLDDHGLFRLDPARPLLAPDQPDDRDDPVPREVPTGPSRRKDDDPPERRTRPRPGPAGDVRPDRHGQLWAEPRTARQRKDPRSRKGQSRIRRRPGGSRPGVSKAACERARQARPRLREPPEGPSRHDPEYLPPVPGDELCVRRDRGFRDGGPGGREFLGEQPALPGRGQGRALRQHAP